MNKLASHPVGFMLWKPGKAPPVWVSLTRVRLYPVSTLAFSAYNSKPCKLGDPMFLLLNNDQPCFASRSKN